MPGCLACLVVFCIWNSWGGASKEGWRPRGLSLPPPRPLCCERGPWQHASQASKPAAQQGPTRSSDPRFACSTAVHVCGDGECRGFAHLEPWNVWVCASTGYVHRCGANCSEREVDPAACGNLVCPISGRCVHGCAQPPRAGARRGAVGSVGVWAFVGLRGLGMTPKSKGCVCAIMGLHTTGPLPHPLPALCKAPPFLPPPPSAGALTA